METTIEHKNKGGNKWVKGIAWLLLTPVLLVSILLLLLYVPAVQNFALKHVTQYASEALGTKIGAGRILLSYPLNLTLQKVSVQDASQDTLFSVGELSVKIRPLPLLDKEIWVSSVLITDVSVRTKQWLEGMSVEGHIGELMTYGGRVYLSKEKAMLNQLSITDADITLQIDSLSASSDTTDTQVNWTILANRLRLRQIAFRLRMPSDSLRLETLIGEATLTNGAVDLGAGQYSVSKLDLSDSFVSYDASDRPPAEGFDPSHLLLSQINLELDSVFYREPDIRAHLRACSMNERSGLQITSLTGRVWSDNIALSVPYCELRLPRSLVELRAMVPWNSLAKDPLGRLQAELKASVHLQDVFVPMGQHVSFLEEKYPDTLLTFHAAVEGNMWQLYVHRFQGALPGAFRIDAHGAAERLTDDVYRSGELSLSVQMQNKQWLKTWLPALSGGRINIPDSLRLKMDATLTRGVYQANMLLSEGNGSARFSGKYHAFQKAYAADLMIDSLNLIRFLPEDSIFHVTGSLRAEGKGTDFFSKATHLIFDGELKGLQYKDRYISGISVEGTYRNHQANARMASAYPYLKGTVTFDGNIRKDKIAGMLIVDMDTLDLHGLNVTEKPLSNSFQLFSEIDTDLKKRHRLDVTLGNWEMAMEKQKVRPKTLTLHAACNEDTTRVSFHAGDLGMVLTGNTDLEALIGKLTEVSDDFQKQMKKDTVAYLQHLTPLLPELDLQVEAGHDNPLQNYLQENDLSFDRFSFRASTSPQDGVNANGLLLSLMKDTIKIDTVRLSIRQDSIDGLRYTCDVTKNRFRRQKPFTAGVHGRLQTGMADIEASYRDAHGETGLRFGARATKQPEGFRLEFFPENPVLGFMPFILNKDNYMEIRTLKDISANLKLIGEQNASLWIHSTETNGKMDELSVEISQINLEKVSHFAPIPVMGGLANVALRYVPMEKSFMVATDASVDDLVYQGGSMGELLLNGVYLPLDNDRHQFDAHFFHNQAEIAMLSALYQPSKNHQVSGTMTLSQLPLKMLNPFLGETGRMQGWLNGRMTLAGTNKKPLWNGHLQLDSAFAYVTAAGTDFRFDDRKIEMKNSKIRFNKYSIYTNGNNPFIINGIVDISRPMHETVNLRLTANNMQLLDTRKEPGSMIYGKMLVDLNTTLKGPLRAMYMRGDLHVLGSTNLTYVVPESKLENRDNFADLVTFTYFSDTIPKRRRWGETLSTAEAVQPLPSVGSMDMLMTVRIDPVVRLKIDLGGEQSNRIELKGGGDLSFQYTSLGDMRLNGRYTISDGLVRYSIPVIPLTDFTIRDGSYVEWRGNPMNPFLNLTALSRLRSSVNLDGQSQMVDFNTGIQVRQELQKMALKFILEAPNNGAVQNQLAAMGEEERSKQAISLLVTGVYLAGDGAGTERMDVGAALSSLLQREINNMLGSLLGEVPFSFDVNTYDGTDGKGRRIDYLGRFYKGFMNDRLYTTLGMRYSTNDPVTGDRFYVDDASLEYRLDTEGSRFIRIFSQKDYENLFEGEIRKSGGEVIFRRKTRRFGDLFDFRRQPAIRKEDDSYRNEPENDSSEKNEEEQEKDE